MTIMVQFGNMHGVGCGANLGVLLHEAKNQGESSLIKADKAKKIKFGLAGVLLVVAPNRSEGGCPLRPIIQPFAPLREGTRRNANLHLTYEKSSPPQPA